MPGNVMKTTQAVAALASTDVSPRFKNAPATAQVSAPADKRVSDLTAYA